MFLLFWTGFRLNGLSASALRQKIILDRLLAILGMKLFDFGLPNIVEIHPNPTVTRLLLPRRHLRWGDLMFGRNLLCGSVYASRLRRKHGLKLVRKTAAPGHMCLLSSRVVAS